MRSACWSNADLLVARGVPADRAGQGIRAMRARLPALSPEEDAALLRQAGFEGVELFFAAFTYKGWVGFRSRPKTCLPEYILGSTG